MLGFSKKGSEYLGGIKEKGNSPLITSPTELIDSHDIFSADIYRIVKTSKTGKAIDNEYTRKFNLTNL